MKTAVLHDALLPGAPPDLEDNLVQAREISHILTELGHETGLVGFGHDTEAAGLELRSLHPDMVFNLVESPLGRSDLIHLAPLLLERLRLPFTGAGARAMLSTSNKLMAKRALAKAGLPTPQWLEPGTDAVALERGPWLVKSVWEHGSIGIEGGAVMENPDAEHLRDALEEKARNRGGIWFAERFVDGREFNLSILEGPDGPEVLPPSEITFDSFAGRHKLVGYRAKWDQESFEYAHTPRRFDFADEDETLLGNLTGLAMEAWRVFGPKGWARVDFRVDEAGQPWILEVNANPCLSADAGFMAAAHRRGLVPKTVVDRIIASATHPGAALRKTA